MSVTDGFKMGYYVWSNKPIDNNNFYLFNGQNLVRNGNRINFIDYIQNVRKAKEFFITEQQYNTYINKYGTCLKFVWYEDNKMLKIPKCTDIVQKDIKTKVKNYLNNINSRYTICYCFNDLINFDVNKYNNVDQDYIKKDDTDYFYYRTDGYFYLLINDIEVSFSLDENIPNALLVRF